MPDAKLEGAQLMAVVGTMTMLARTSPLHSYYQIAQLLDRTWPSIMRGHFCLYRERQTGKAVGFCNWILVNQSNLDEILQEKRPIKPDDWDSGEIPFFPEMIAPFGHMRAIAADLRDNAMNGIPWAYSIRGVAENDDGTVPERKIFKWKGRQRSEDSTGNSDEKISSPFRLI